MAIPSPFTTAKRAQDVLYIYDTMLAFNALIESDLAKIWEGLKPKLTSKQRASVDSGVAELFGDINDTIRAAVDIRKDVRVEPLDILRLCQNGFQDLFRGAL